MRLELGAVLGEPGEATRYVYFPIDSFVSLVAGASGPERVEVGMVGREGMVGVQIALGVATTPLHAMVQGAGSARRIRATILRRELARSEALRRMLDRYIYVLMTQLATSSACARFHQLSPRLARWLLMSHDRSEADRFHVTHEFLGYMLGVRRVGITGAAGDLQRRGLIRYHRGEVSVLDRAGLEQAACNCYVANERVYVRQMG